MKSALLIFALLFIVAPANAEVSDVFIWQPMPGKVSEVVRNGLDIKPLHEKLGARIWIGVDRMNRVHYVASFDNWSDWAKFQDAVQKSKELAEWWEKANMNPVAKLIQNYAISEVSGE